jgi:DUF1680 family protein
MKKANFTKTFFIVLAGITLLSPFLNASNKASKVTSRVGNLTPGVQQDKLYANNFPLSDVTLLEGPFKHARDLDIKNLMKYDVDRLLAPYRKEAGLSTKAISYPNWIRLDGHIGGHYLTALAINYAATGDTTCKRLMDYMVAELKVCQEANAVKYPSWGVGYAGGVPASSIVWSSFPAASSLTDFNIAYANLKTAWVPWYNLHKTYAGLRDAWLYGNNTSAKTIFLAFCDWGINITSALSDANMDQMLFIEHGSMNEIFADAYQMTGDAKYLTAAKRFSHKTLLNSMSAGIDNLDNRHANTNIAKAVGFQRIAEVSNDTNYIKAAQFFWQNVTSNRTIALGGNSRKENFPTASSYMDFINVPNGPESCNTYNMLKLTEDLFRINPQAKYADFYERALYNHILSTQHPDHGGYVYLTSARPRHYRVYSSSEAMWCCVGTGMENHVKYGEFIYTHSNDSLYLNLFIASELNWKEKGVTIRQETVFPEEEKTKLIVKVTTPTPFKLMVRSPKWVNAGKLKIVINKDTMLVQSVPQTYIAINRTWHNGDSVRILLPMENSIEQLPNVSSYVALMHGPILLSAKTGTQDLLGLVPNLGHIAVGSLLPLEQAPIVVSDKATIASKIIPVVGKPLTFSAKGLFVTKADSALVLEPFYKIHDARYMIYWMNLTKTQYQLMMDSLAAVQNLPIVLDRTIDNVAPGEQQPEVDHNLESRNSTTGNFQNEFWRAAGGSGFISYKMLTKKISDLSLMVRYWGNETGSRSFNISVDGTTIATENIVGKWNLKQFINVEYPIPNNLTAGKDTITVKFQPINTSNTAGGLFDIRIYMPLSTTNVQPFYKASDCNVSVQKNKIIVNGLVKPSTITVFDSCGHVLHNVESRVGTTTILCKSKGVCIVKIVCDKKTQMSKVFVE